MKPISLLILLVVCCAPAVFGCNSNALPTATTANISGTVTLDGEPMPAGDVQFVNAAEGRNDMLPIKDGKFAGKVTVGERTVQIRAYKEVKAEAAGGMYEGDNMTSTENYLPAKYNDESTISATIEEGKTYEFEVTSGSSTSGSSTSESKSESE